MNLKMYCIGALIYKKPFINELVVSNYMKTYNIVTTFIVGSATKSIITVNYYCSK